MLTPNWIHYEIIKEDEFLIEQLATEVLGICNQRKAESIFMESKGIVDKITELLEKEEQNDRNYKLIYIGTTLGIAASFNVIHLPADQAQDIENIAAASVISIMRTVYHNIFLEELPLLDIFIQQVKSVEEMAVASVSRIPGFAQMTRNQLLEMKKRERDHTKQEFKFFEFEF